MEPLHAVEPPHVKFCEIRSADFRKFAMPVLVPRNSCSKGAQEHVREVAASKFREVGKCLALAKQHGVGYKRAFSEAKKQWPQLTLNAIKNRMAGRVAHGEEYQGNQLLSNSEMEELAEGMELAADHGQAMTPMDRDVTVNSILEYRKKCNEGGGRKHRKFSPATLKCLKNGKPGRNFWRCFYAGFKGRLNRNSVKV